MTWALAVACTAALSPAAWAQGAETPDATMRQIIRADYQGNREALARLAAALVPADGAADGVLIRYWRGFAWWRRAINGFNETPLPTDLGTDLARATDEFEQAVALRPDFVDGLAGLLSCLQLNAFLARDDQDTLKRLLPVYRQTLERAQRLDGSHPRLLWVIGQGSWYTPPGAPASIVAERQAAAFGMYDQGLREMARRRATRPLEPVWGEAELLMNLAWSRLNAATPDPVSAREYADRALALAPDWHYVKDILLPQIRRALSPK